MALSLSNVFFTFDLILIDLEEKNFLRWLCRVLVGNGETCWKERLTRFFVARRKAMVLFHKICDEYPVSKINRKKKHRVLENKQLYLLDLDHEKCPC